MTEHRRWVRPWVVLFAAALFIWSGAAALGSDENAIDMTGHWASPLEASGIDIVQSGSSVWGTSLSGLDFVGSISGRRVEFTYWRGGSYERADPEDRGSGVMAVAKNGQRAAVTWRNDKKKPDEGSFVIVRVGPTDASVPQPAREDLLPLIEAADPGSSLSPEEAAQLDDLYDQVIDQLEAIRYPGLTDPTKGPTPGPSELPVMAPTPGPESQASEPPVSVPQADDADLKGVVETLMQGIEGLKLEIKDLYEELQ